jgi:DNA (cytosine-5)-methyltransferase 1
MGYLSLFSGTGGFDIAFTDAGMECVGVCEIDKNAQEVLKHNFPGVSIYDDVKEIGYATHERGTVDLICGGFPCQDLSIAGKRAGLAGERSGLWYEFARIIDEFEPGWVVIENVPGLLSSGKGSDFAVIVQWLAERGYGVVWRVLDAQYFGVPQRRRRVFVVGHLGDGRAAEVLFESEGMFGDIAKGGQEGKEVAKTIAGGSNKCHSDITSGQQDGNLITPSIVSNGDAHSGFRNEKGLICMAHGQANAEIVRDGEPSLSCNHEQPIVATSRTLRGGSKGGGKGYLGLEDKAMTLGGQEQMIWEMQHASEAYRESQGGDDPTLQQRMGTGGNNVPLVGVRRLTPTECARLQGFPDDWNDWLSDSARYRQFGNAVAVPVVRWIAERIIRLGTN